VLQVRERLLILPIIGVIDPQRARQLTEQLLRGIRTNRAKVVVIDITGVAAMDATVANHLVQTVEASRCWVLPLSSRACRRRCANARYDWS